MAALGFRMYTRVTTASVCTAQSKMRQEDRRRKGQRRREEEDEERGERKKGKK